jgi:hypothetical protein
MIAIALVVAALGFLGGAWLIAREIGGARRDATLQGLLALFGPTIERARQDPRQLLAWHPLATAARRLYPDAFLMLDGAVGDTFPFTKVALEEAHARWTTDWLAWERDHDADYKQRASAVEAEMIARGAPPTDPARARLAQIEREKLERYQERYQEYVRVSKALAGLSKAEEKR